ncbi:uncharacterized protein SPSK_08034 [Sporothrix schenckii 1099-18]|uniref:Uncharacterized protein n=2 Tax=Sporothrix schenckii TaxID=29908 RepID=U7Q184_SPOS1|nr:uncharacterized protein SPSK_08034 [Sporothrix schenckii 1099-18]ERT00770.1 hypothetical protein HMPREF1624_02003 [Sporothrix schenckii ATCC 58251]KJR87853.1 hypothetical protein SPSK_08034 [Sporothrix schenckii 1099-18]
MPNGAATVPADNTTNDSGDLTAPSMSASSSRASNVDDMWSADPSRRGSDASSTTSMSTSDLPSLLSSEKLKASLAAGGVPMAVSASESSCNRNQNTPAPAPTRRLKFNGDPLERSFPKPEGDIDVGAALARDPLKWSLGHWKKNARDVVQTTTSAAVSKKRFDDIKDELRRAQLDMAKTTR